MCWPCSQLVHHSQTFASTCSAPHDQLPPVQSHDSVRDDINTVMSTGVLLQQLCVVGGGGGGGAQ